MIPALLCVGLRHTYGQGEMAVPVLKGVDLEELLERLEMTEHRRKKAAVLSGGKSNR